MIQVTRHVFQNLYLAFKTTDEVHCTIKWCEWVSQREKKLIKQAEKQGCQLYFVSSSFVVLNQCKANQWL